MKTIGLIGGMSWESTTLYYQIINREVSRRRGGLSSARMNLVSLDFQDIAQRQRAVDCAALHRLARQEQRGRPGGAVVVDVDHRDAGHAHLVQRALAAGGVAVDVAHVGLLHLLVADAGIGQRAAQRLGGHLGIGLVGARLGEGDHADADHVDGGAHGESLSS